MPWRDVPRSRLAAIGGEAGARPWDHLWLSFGYNLTGFSDRDMVAANHTAKGAFIRMRAKL